MSNGVAPPATQISGPLYTVTASSSSSPTERTFSESLHDHFDAVFRRVTMGRRDLKAVKAYLEARASCERNYAEKLTKDNSAASELTDSSSSRPRVAVYEGGRCVVQRCALCAGLSVSGAE